MKLFHLIFIFLFVISFTFCGGSAPATMSPEMAQNMLKLRGFDFNEDEFFKAIRLGDAEAIGAFFDAGINPNAKTPLGETSLTFAVKNYDEKTVKALLLKADVNLRDDLGQSALYLALTRKKDDVVKLLLDRGADVNVPGATSTTKNQSPLLVAVANGRKDFIQTFLEKGADPNIADSEGAVPLTEACVENDPNIETIKLLLEKGANVNHQEINGATALFYVASNDRSTSETRIAIAKLLLEKGADKNIKAKNGKSPLDAAREMKNADIIGLLAAN